MNAEPTPATDSAEPPPPTESRFAFSAATQRWIEVLAGRVAFSVSYPVLAGVAAGVIVLIVLAYATGRRIGERSAPTDSTANTARSDSPGGVLGVMQDLKGGALPSRPKDDGGGNSGTRASGPDTSAAGDKHPAGEKSIVASPGNEPAAGNKTDRDTKAARTDKGSQSEGEKSGPEQYTLERGKSYVQIQCFSADKEKDATDAARFFQDNGVPIALQHRKRDIVLYVRQAFTIKGATADDAKQERAKADELIKRVKALGKEYARQGGRYSFNLASLEEPSP
ncbi:MAG: hypothetical protein HZB38_18380 [Planctomycetes bacterium]|nr:hypothetical protein [Planctomycetota bacterium]